MSDQQPNRPDDLREISHLFLSNVRDLQTGGAKRPTRLPPGAKRPDVSIDLTPEEFAQMVGGTDTLGGLLDAPDEDPTDAAAEAADPIVMDDSQLRKVPVTAVLASHLNGSQHERVKQYARHLAAKVGRVGLIELDANEFRLMSFEPLTPGEPDFAQEQVDAVCPSEAYELSHIADAINELHADVAHWLLLLPSPRTPEARAVLRLIDSWVMLSTCDHDGVVSCYRTIKSLTDLFRPSPEGTSDLPGAPTLGLATFADDDAEAERVYQKLWSVCRQFLHWPISSDPRVLQTAEVAEHLIMSVRPTHDKGQMASSAQWEIVSSFLVSIQPEFGVEPVEEKIEAVRHIADIELPMTPTLAAVAPVPTMRITPPVTPIQNETINPVIPMNLTSNEAVDDVVDLVDGDDSAGALLSSICRHEAGSLVECPVRPPMLPDARLAVDRNHNLVLLTCARRGLGDLQLVGKAYAWLIENRGLVAMAMPQFGIDAHSLPQLRLIVDQSDMSAESLQTLVQSGRVTVQAYRKLRWGGRTGLLLQAA